MILVRIYLYLNSKIMTFEIPANISGSFSFDENPEDEDKLINIDGREEGWVLYSTSEARVLNNGSPVNEMPLLPNNYYVIQKNDKNYLIYATELFDNSFSIYTYNEGINLTIGSESTCNIIYPTNLINGTVAKIYKYENNIVIDGKGIYINNKIISKPNYPLKSGDTIHIYGLRIVFLNNLILINNPMNSINLNLNNTTLSKYNFPPESDYVDNEIKDRELYVKEDYFSKSPRIRRLIHTKEIEFSSPPKLEGERELPLLLTIGPMATMAILSGIRLASVISNIASGKATIGSQATQLVQ